MDFSVDFFMYNATTLNMFLISVHGEGIINKDRGNAGGGGGRKKN